VEGSGGRTGTAAVMQRPDSAALIAQDSRYFFDNDAIIIEDKQSTLAVHRGPYDREPLGC
jgi:hypothetical protein